MGRTIKTKGLSYKLLVVVLVPCLILTGGLGWLLASEAGLRWAAGVAERQSGSNLSVSGISGSFLDSISIQKIILRGDSWRVTVNNAQIEWKLVQLLRGELEVSQVSADKVEVLSLPTEAPTVLPDNMGLPLEFIVKQMEIDTFNVVSEEGAEPDFSASTIEAKLTGDARFLKLQSLKANLKIGDFAGSGELALSRPYGVKAQATLASVITLSGKSELAHLNAVAEGDLQNIDAKFDGNGAGIRINGTGQVAPFANVPLVRMEIAFGGMHLDKMIDGAPHTVVSGSVDLHGIPGGELEGILQALNERPAALDKNGLPLQIITAQVRLSQSRLQLQKLDASLPNNGHITGALSWELQPGKLAGQLNVLKLDPAALDTRLPSADLHGDIMLESTGNSQHATVSLSDGKMDMNGEVTRQGDRVELSNLRLAHGKTTLIGQGQLVMDRRRTFRFTSQLSQLNLSEFAATPATNLNAGLEVSGTLLPKTKGIIKFNLSRSHFAHHDISGNGHLEFTGLQCVAAAIALHLGDNRLNLDFMHGTDADRARLKLDAPNLGQIMDGLDGQIAGHAELTGSLSDPRLQFTTQGKHLKWPDGQRIAALDATGDLASNAMQFNLFVKDYRSTGSLRMPEANVSLQGSRAEHILNASARIAQDEEVVGELTIKANGGLSDPAQGWSNLHWRGSIDELAAQGIVPFHLLTAAPISFAKDSIHLGTADLAIAGGHIEFSDTQWTPLRSSSSGHFTSLNVRAVNMQQSTISSDAFDSMRIGGSWQATVDEHWQGHMQIQREGGDWLIDGATGLRLGLSSMDLTLSAAQDKLQVKLNASGEQLGEMKAQADIPLTHTGTGWTILPDAPLAGKLRLHSDDLAWLGPILDSNLQSGGQLDLDAQIIGTLQSPRLHGELHGDALNLALLDQRIRLEQGELKARFDSDAVYVDRFKFSAPYQSSPRDKLFSDYSLPAGTGRLNASGRIDLTGNSGDLKITAERMPLSQRPDRWIIASGSGHARYGGKILMLDGDIRADAGIINQPVSDRPQISEDVQILGKEPASRAGPPTAVDATLDLGNHFYIRASGFEGRLDGQLKVRGTPGEPLRVTGSIAAQDAIFDAYGQRLQVERGLVNFQGPLDDPGLNILALRKGLDVEAGVEVTGTVRRPSVRLVSTPNVPDGEKLSWIVLGRVPESSGVDSALLLAAAGSIMGGQSAGQLGQTLGIDEISLSQQNDATSQPVQKVTVGKQLNARARISYEHSLNEVGGITKFTYTLTPRITIVTRTGTEDALDLFYTFRFY
jgi:translocation and assembly module TamB